VFEYDNFPHVLILSFSQSAISTFFFWIWVKCLYNKQNNTWTLGDMNLSSCVHSKINFISSRAHVLFSKYHIYSRHPLCYIWGRTISLLPIIYDKIMEMIRKWRFWQTMHFAHWMDGIARAPLWRHRSKLWHHRTSSVITEIIFQASCSLNQSACYEILKMCFSTLSSKSSWNVCVRYLCYVYLLISICFSSRLQDKKKLCFYSNF
jgi:hypothetical protein